MSLTPDRDTDDHVADHLTLSSRHRIPLLPFLVAALVIVEDRAGHRERGARVRRSHVTCVS